MPTFQNTTFSSFFKRIFQVSQTSNTGVDSSTRSVETGDGVKTSISISDDVFQVQPQNDNTTGTMLVKNKGGDNILAVDTTNSKVLVGSTRTAVNTFFQPFGCNLQVPVAGQHMPLLAAPSGYYATAIAEQSLGTGTDPATTYDMSTGNAATFWIPCLFRMPLNATLDSATVFFTSYAGAASTLNFHIMSYAIDIDNGGTSGDLSDGVVVADSGTQAVERTSVDYLALTIQSASVDAGRVLIATVESTDTNSVTVNMTLKYHIR